MMCDRLDTFKENTDTPYTTLFVSTQIVCVQLCSATVEDNRALCASSFAKQLHH